jgi:membrane fusion protein, multidrug efflux system
MRLVGRSRDVQVAGQADLATHHDVADASAASRVATVAPPPTRTRRRWVGVGLRLYLVLLAAGLIVVVTREWDEWVGSATYQTTDDAYLQADSTPLAAQVPGYVHQILVHDFERVKAGDTLVEIVDDDYRARVAQAKANVATARAAIETIVQQKTLQQALVEQAEATIKATEADVTRYRLERTRQEALLRSTFGTRQITEQAVDNAERTEATLALNRAQLEAQRQQKKVLDGQEQAARATLAAQLAALDLAQINLGRTRIRAPVDGMVGRRQVQAGQYLNVGTQVISIVPLPNVYVIANYKETQLTRIRVGQSASVTVDTFPGAVLTGHVDSWSPASGAEFSLLPPDNATGNFTKVVQRIPVKIMLNRDSTIDDLLRPGMSVIATVDTSSTPASSTHHK